MNHAVAVKPALVVDEFTPIRRNTLHGFCRVVMPSGMILMDVQVHSKNGRPWAMPASKPLIGSDGVAQRDRVTGKPKYVPIVAFSSKDIRDRFSDAVIRALLVAYPDALS